MASHHHMKRFLTVFLVGCIGASTLTLAAATASTQVDFPYQDTGFTPATPNPDPDQIIVRERYYGAEGIDLTEYGIGEGPVDFVQSIYFRYFISSNNNDPTYFTGLVVFPPEIEILGFVTNGGQLGGSNDDGDWTATDEIFGIGDDPNLYSEGARGFDSGGHEFIGQISPHSFVFGLSITSGVDDFRVIVDYGDQLGMDLSFNIYSFDYGGLGELVPSIGYRVGDDADPVVFGSGDFGEIGALIDIPLTSNLPPQASGALPFDTENSLFILRDTSGPTYVDGYDARGNIPVPNLFELAEGISSPAGITDGGDGNLYCIGLGGGFGVINVGVGVVAYYNIGNLTGNNVDITDLHGNDLLFVIRDTSGQTWVDLVNRDLATIDYNFPLPDGPTSPVGITGGADGRLYALGEGGGLTGFVPDGSSMEQFTLGPSGGDYVDLTDHHEYDSLYLLRDTSGDSYIDVVNLNDFSVEYGFSSFPNPSSPAGVTAGYNGYLYVIGVGSSGAASYTVIDPINGNVLLTHSFMDFTGSNKSITSFLPSPSSVRSLGVAQASSLRHIAVPNPFNAQAQVIYELAHPDRVRISIYNVRGVLVRELIDEDQAAGLHGVPWDGCDEQGRVLPSGSYVYRIEWGANITSGKMLLAK